MTALVSMAIGDDRYQRIVAPCLSSHRRYCAAHNYGYHLLQDPMSSRPHSWSRIPLLKQVMQCTANEWLIWIDADALITNRFLSLEPILDYMNKRDKLVAYTIDGANNLNDGIAIYRNDPRVIDYLEYLWERTEYINHPWWCNAAAVVAQVDKREFFEAHVFKINATNALNSYVGGRSPWSIGDWCIHFAGMSQEDRAKLIPAFDTFARVLEPFIKENPGRALASYLGVAP